MKTSKLTFVMVLVVLWLPINSLGFQGKPDDVPFSAHFQGALKSTTHFIESRRDELGLSPSKWGRPDYVTLNGIKLSSRLNDGGRA